MLELLIIVNLIILIIHIIFLYKNNQINFYKINLFNKVKGGHYMDKKIRDYTIFPFINKIAIGIHDSMHWVFQYGDIKEDNEVKNTLKKEIEERKKKNDYYNKILNKSQVTNETRLYLSNKIKNNNNIIKNVLDDII